MITSALAAFLVLGASSGSVTSALQHVNTLRRDLGLTELRLNTALSKAAEGHANYMLTNKALSHDQVPGKKAFTGKSSLDRARAAGFKGRNVLEDIAFGPETEALTLLFDGPYHRRPVIQPDISEVGIGVAGQFTVLLFDVQTSTDPLIYPRPNQLVPVSWSGKDMPSPYRMHSQAKPPFGPAIQIYVQGAGRFKLGKFTLEKIGGGPVACLLNSPSNDEFLPDGAMLIPTKPLDPKSEYRARFAATGQLGNKIEKDWTFKTQ